MVSRAAAASEKFIRAGRSFPGSTVDDEGLPLSVFQLDPKCCERLLHSPAIGELGCTDGSWVPNPAGQGTGTGHIRYPTVLLPYFVTLGKSEPYKKQ